MTLHQNYMLNFLTYKINYLYLIFFNKGNLMAIVTFIEHCLTILEACLEIEFDFDI